MITGMSGVSALGGLLSGFKPEGLGGAAETAGAAQAGGGSFMDALSNIAGNAVDGLDKAQGLSVQALQGDVATREVVDAVMSAEQSLQTAIAIRDKIVTAYLEVSRMAI